MIRITEYRILKSGDQEIRVSGGGYQDIRESGLNIEWIPVFTGMTINKYLRLSAVKLVEKTKPIAGLWPEILNPNI